MNKLLGAEVLAGSPYLFLDNIKGKMSFSALESFITAPRWKARVLGLSKNFNEEKNCLIYVTANFANPSPDLLRRSLFIDLFVKTADPASRTIKDILKMRILRR